MRKIRVLKEKKMPYTAEMLASLQPALAEELKGLPVELVILFGSQARALFGDG